jgi:hypothetical protein
MDPFLRTNIKWHATIDCWLTIVTQKNYMLKWRHNQHQDSAFIVTIYSK